MGPVVAIPDTIVRPLDLVIVVRSMDIVVSDRTTAVPGVNQLSENVGLMLRLHTYLRERLARLIPL